MRYTVYMSKQWEVYIVRTTSGRLYTGISTDVDRRFAEHKDGPKGARFFKISPAEEIVYRESHPDRSSASKRESAIKKLTRAQKQELIESA